MTAATSRLITQIPNEDAVRVLALVLDYRRRLPDPAAARQAAQRLDALRASPDLLVAVDDAGAEASEGAPLPPGGTAPSEPELARAALSHLVHADPELAARTAPSDRTRRGPSRRTPRPADPRHRRAGARGGHRQLVRTVGVG